MTRRLMTVLILVLLIGLFAVTPSHKTEAQGYFYTITYTGGHQCGDLSAAGSTSVSTSESFNLPANTTYSISESLNGAPPGPPFSVLIGPPASGTILTSHPNGPGYPAQGGAYTLTWIISVSSGSFNSTSVITLACNNNLNPYPNLDGIVTVINPNGPSGAFQPLFTDGRCNQEPDQPVAVYSDNAGGVILYAIHEGVGYFALHVPKLTFEANPTRSENYLIVENLGVRVYRLFDGGLQVNRVKTDLSEYAVDLKKCGAG